MSPVARKRHHCGFCGLPIEPGEEYRKERLTPWDHPDNDSFFTIKGHLRCWDLWEDNYGDDCDWAFPDHHEFRAALAEYRRAREEVP